MPVRKAVHVVPAVVAALGIWVTYLTYAPGLVPADAQDQLHQAQTGHFNDVHPPIMAWLWSKTNAIIPGPEGFFLLLIALYWGGFFLLIRRVMKISLARAVIASALPFSPILFNFAGTIWKDVLVFGCFLVAAGIILTRDADDNSRFPPLRSIVVVTLLLVGSLARWNSVPGVVPLIALAVWPRSPARTPLRRTAYRLLICAPIVLLVWATAGKLLNATVIHAQKTGFANMLPLWDLTGMSHRLGENLLPGTWSPQQSRQIVQSCYHAIDDNNLIMTGTSCSFIRESLVRQGYWHATVLFPLWARMILDHPKTYLETRLTYVHTLFWPNDIFMFDADDGSNAFNHHAGGLFQTEKRLLWFCKTAPILHFPFTLAFWMIAALILTAGFAIAVMRGGAGCYPSLLLSLSAGINLWPLVIIGPDGQLRFAYWPIAAMSIALLIAQYDLAKTPKGATEAVLAG